MRTSIERLARKFLARGAFVAFEEGDLVDAAIGRIWKRRRAFDPSRSGFSTWAGHQARGGMLDEIRELDHVPRIERLRAKAEGRALRKVETWGIAASIFERPEPLGRGPLAEAGDRDLWLSVRAILGRRPADVLEKYYRLGLTLKQIGREIGLSESRVCQVHAAALRSLRYRWQWKGGIA